MKFYSLLSIHNWWKCDPVCFVMGVSQLKNELSVYQGLGDFSMPLSYIADLVSW